MIINVHRWIVNDCEIAETESCNRTELSPMFLRFCLAKTFGYKWSRWWWSCFVSASKISWRSRKHLPPSQWGTHSGLSSYVQFSRLPSLDRVWRCMKTKSVSPVCFKSVMSFGTCTILWQFHVIRRENSKLWFLDVSCIVEYSDLESCLSFKFALIRRKNQLEELPHRSLLTIWCYVIPIRRLAPSSMFDFKAAHVNVYSIWSTKPTKKRLPCMVP